MQAHYPLGFRHNAAHRVEHLLAAAALVVGHSVQHCGHLAVVHLVVDNKGFVHNGKHVCRVVPVLAQQPQCARIVHLGKHLAAHHPVAGGNKQAHRLVFQFYKHILIPFVLVTPSFHIPLHRAIVPSGSSMGRCIFLPYERQAVAKASLPEKRAI